MSFTTDQLKAILKGGSRPYIHPKLDMSICYDNDNYIEHYGYNSICIPNCNEDNIAHVKGELHKYLTAMTLGDNTLAFDDFNCKWILEFNAKNDDDNGDDNIEKIKIEVRLCYYHHRKAVFAEVQHKLGKIGLHHTIRDDLLILITSNRFLRGFKIATAEKNN